MNEILIKKEDLINQLKRHERLTDNKTLINISIQENRVKFMSENYGITLITFCNARTTGKVDFTVYFQSLYSTIGSLDRDLGVSICQEDDDAVITGLQSGVNYKLFLISWEVKRTILDKPFAILKRKSFERLINAADFAKPVKAGGVGVVALKKDSGILRFYAGNSHFISVTDAVFITDIESPDFSFKLPHEIAKIIKPFAKECEKGKDVEMYHHKHGLHVSFKIGDEMLTCSCFNSDMLANVYRYFQTYYNKVSTFNRKSAIDSLKRWCKNIKRDAIPVLITNKRLALLKDYYNSQNSTDILSKENEVEKIEALRLIEGEETDIGAVVNANYLLKAINHCCKYEFVNVSLNSIYSQTMLVTGLDSKVVICNMRVLEPETGQ